MDERERTLAVISDALAEHRAAFEGFVRARASASDVEDILQVAAMRAIERAQTLRDPERVMAWLYRVHRNVIADQMRANERSLRLADAVSACPSVDDDTAAALCACSVRQASMIHERYAEILELVDLGGHTAQEAARVLGVSANNATVRLHRARKALRKRLEEHCGVTTLRECLDCRCVEAGCCAA